MRPTSGKTIFICVLFGSILVLTQCGLPKPFIQLIAPNAIYNTGVDYFQFKKITGAAEVEAEFRGFELYYRFFNVTDTPEYVSTFEELAAKGYRRVNSSTDVYGEIPSRPLILVDSADRGNLFTVKIDFTSITFPEPTIATIEILTVPINIQDIRRGIPDETPSEYYEQFSDFEELVDYDINSLVWSEFQDEGKLVLYALSYGYDIEFGNLYSEPVWLGEITRDFVP